jgi:hypothetical protein
MMRQTLWALAAVFVIAQAQAADVVPTDIQQPGTQPQEVGNLESPGKCANCHGGYNLAVEPFHNWAGSMMAQAGRDPIFWVTLPFLDTYRSLCASPPPQLKRIFEDLPT